MPRVRRRDGGAMMAGFIASARVVEVACTVEIEQTAASFHAYAIPDAAVREGDVVVVHDAPSYVEFGERLVRECRATVVHAGPLGRLWARIGGMFELTELYEVGFAPKELPQEDR